MSGRPRSLTLRLTLLFALASTAVLALMGVVFYYSLQAHFLHEDALELQGKIELVRNLARRAVLDGTLPSLDARLRDALVGHHNLHLEVRGAGRQVVVSIPEHTTPLADAARRRVDMKRVEGIDIETFDVAGSEYRRTGFDLPEIGGQAVLTMSAAHHQMFMGRVLDTVLVSVLVAVVAAIALGFGAARVGIAPLRAFTRLAALTSAERLDDRIAVEKLPRELTELGHSFNDMLARLEDSFRRLSEFSSDLAHELRTPISALMTQAQVALSRARTADEYREVIYSAMEEYDRLARMTTDMLLLARADSGALVTRNETFEIRPEVEALFEFYDALAESRGIQLAAKGEGWARGERDMFRRALSNLLSNAIRHSKPDGAVTVTITGGERDVHISVANEGEPIPDVHLARLFDRFYMVDASRQRSSDGSGLGLAIAKSIVEAHGGSVAVTSDARETKFDMKLPAGVPAG